MNLKIEVKDVEKKYEKKKIVDKLSFNVIEEEFLSIIGPSGCGKTTILYLMAGFIDNFGGKINIHGKIGFVFQDHNLLPWKTVKENIEMGPINNNLKVDIKRLLHKIDLDGFGSYYPHQLSEGMKQRVGIARALANYPEILLMDEPFGSLDYLTRIKMQELLLKLKKGRKLTIVLVTHDIDEAIRVSDRIIVLSALPARLIKTFDVNQKRKAHIKKEILGLIQNGF
ncbi:ATP-binding cassette domain-containing protein [Candidatus Woesearchaeota archaeon]|nr:ATP-binding cassette domain-containing protein [Candidatus Woesearchaeota archaeon]